MAAVVGAGVSGKALDKLDKRMHDSTNIVRGLQSTVTKLQNEVTKNNAEVAKALKAQAAVEKAIRGIEVLASLHLLGTFSGVADGVLAHTSLCSACQIWNVLSYSNKMPILFLDLEFGS